MPQATERDPIYRGRRFTSGIIELCVRWYITWPAVLMVAGQDDISHVRELEAA